MDRSEKNIKDMFDGIAGDYDRLNHILSFGIDRIWRRRAVREIVCGAAPLHILDIACGTGDFSIEIAEHANCASDVVGIDISQGMLDVMRHKVSRLGLESRVSMHLGNAESLDFPDDSFDRIAIAFGIRNFENRCKSLEEILRVLKPGGKLVILELSAPSCRLLRSVYKLYLSGVLPKIGGHVSGNRKAYEYLASSILAFPGKNKWMKTMSDIGYDKVAHKAFSFGVCRMYTASKKL